MNNNLLSEGSLNGLRLVNIETPGVLNGTNTLMYSIKNPMAYIYNADMANNIYDWYTNVNIYQDDKLWIDEQFSKNLYDPCPKGWRIPTNDTWIDLSHSIPIGSGINVSNGRLYNEVTWFPTCGFRHCVSGALCQVGLYASYWSPDASAEKALRLLFCDTGLYLGSVDYRASGFSVRCIQE